jgi:ArsR family transcriptional regulator
MFLVGCIRPFSDFSFTIPVYQEQDEYYFHEISKSLQIIKFNIAKGVNDVIKLQNNIFYKVNDIAPLVFYQNSDKFIFGPADSILKLIGDIINGEDREFHYLNRELIYLKSCIANSVTKKKNVLLRENDIDNDNDNDNEEDKIRKKYIFDSQKLHYSNELMEALAHSTRLRILKFIDENEYINVNKIYSDIDIEQSIISQHLKKLRMSGVVSVEITGKFHIYQINYEVLEKVEFALKRFINRLI